MFNFLRNKRLFLLMVGFLICIVLIGMTINGREKLTMPEQFIKDSISSVQRVIAIPISSVKDFFVSATELKHIYKENEELRAVAALYAREKVEYNFIANENERLQEALEFKQHQKELYDYKYLIAQVIAISNDPNNPTININLGSNHGIEKNMAVVTVDGLLGIVTNVSPFTSSVTPITQLNSSSPVFSAISATVLGKEFQSFGILSSYDGEQERIVMSMIDENDPMMKDDIVITSGLGNLYPRGLRVGTIEMIQVGDFGLTHVATIKPFVKLNQLTEVFVVQMNKVEGLSLEATDEDLIMETNEGSSEDNATLTNDEDKEGE